MQTTTKSTKTARYDATWTRPGAGVPEMIDRLATILSAERGGKWYPTEVLTHVLSKEISARSAGAVR